MWNARCSGRGKRVEEGGWELAKGHKKNIWQGLHSSEKAAAGGHIDVSKAGETAS